MKNLLLLLVALTPLPCAAREAVLDVFAVEAKQDFAVLTPELGQSVDRNAAIERARAPTAELQNQIAGDRAGLPDSFSEDISNLRPAVPVWMRAGSAFMRSGSGAYRPSLDDPLCQNRSFFARYGLSRDAQARRSAYFKQIVDVACDAGVPVVLFDALIAQESRYRPFAQSSAGAMGMAQLMPGTAQYLRVKDPRDVRQNLIGGARYLREQLDRFGTWELALAAYNSGPGRVEQYGGIPPFRETRNYVRTIMSAISGTNRASGVSRGLATLPAPNPFRQVLLASFGGPSDIPEH